MTIFKNLLGFVFGRSAGPALPAQAEPSTAEVISDISHSSSDESYSTAEIISNILRSSSVESFKDDTVCDKIKAALENEKSSEALQQAAEVIKSFASYTTPAYQLEPIAVAVGILALSDKPELESTHQYLIHQMRQSLQLRSGNGRVSSYRGGPY